MKKLLVVLILAFFVSSASAELVQNHKFEGVDETPWIHAGLWGSFIDFDNDYYRGAGYGDGIDWSNNYVYQETGAVFQADSIYVLIVEWRDGNNGAIGSFDNIQIAISETTNWTDAKNMLSGPNIGVDTWQTATLIFDTATMPAIVGEGIAVGARNMDIVGGAWMDINYMSLNIVPQAVNPSPPADSDPLDNADEVGTLNGFNLVDVNIGWDLAAGVTILSQELYINENEPNFISITPVALTSTDVSYALTDLNPGSVYYWTVDTITGTGTLSPSMDWGFETVNIVPSISQHPADTLVAEGDTAVFEVTASSPPSAPIDTYEWFQSADQIIGGDSPIGLEGNPLYYVTSAGDEATYVYCKVTNLLDGVTYSDLGLLEIERLMGYWKLDSSLDSEDGQIGSALYSSYAAGIDGNAAEFLPQDIIDPNYIISVADSAEEYNNFILGLTASMWINTDVTGNWKILAGKQDRANEDPNGTADAEGWSFNLTAAGAPNLVIGSLGGATSSTMVTDNSWHYITATYDGGVAKLYIDGVLDTTSVALTGVSATNLMPLEIGGESASQIAGIDAQCYAFNGLMDEVKIYNYALGATDVLDDFNEFAAVKLNKCLADYASAMDVSGPLDVPDCRIDLYDFAVIAAGWLGDGCHGDPGTYPCDM